MLFHEEERVLCNLSDEHGHRYSPVIMTFAEGDSYLCEFETSYESCTLDYDMDDPRYEDFWEYWYEVTETIEPGPNAETATTPDGGRSKVLLISYRHFPVKVTMPDGRVLYAK